MIWIRDSLNSLFINHLRLVKWTLETSRLWRRFPWPTFAWGLVSPEMISVRWNLCLILIPLHMLSLIFIWEDQKLLCKLLEVSYQRDNQLGLLSPQVLRFQLRKFMEVGIKGWLTMNLQGCCYLSTYWEITSLKAQSESTAHFTSVLPS